MNSKFLFLFLDYGNSDLLVLSDICHLPEKFASQPQYCYRTKFNGIDNELEASYEILTEYLLNENSKFKVVSYSDGYYFIELFDSDSCFNSKIDPNYKLFNNITQTESAIGPVVKIEETSICRETFETKLEITKRVELSEKLLEIGSEHEFTVSFVSEKELCFNLKCDVEKLEGLQKEINSPEVTGPLKTYNNLNELKVNDVVLAKFYEEDRSTFNWYRARIQAINDDKITAFYLGMSSFIV